MVSKYMPKTMLSLAAIAVASFGTGSIQAQVTEFTLPPAAQATVTPQSLETAEIPATPNSFTLAQGRERYAAIEPTEKYSYLGVGWNIGLSDANEGVAEDGFSLLSKIAITKNISVRPGVIFGDESAILLPVTYDFPLRASDPFDQGPVTPYLGAGLVIDTSADENTDFLLTGGVDYRFTKDWVANIGVNVGFDDDESDFGLMLGVGYVFPHNR